jgi:DNA-binding transcriptional LysR family regulator
MGISVMEDNVAEETAGLERLLPDMEPIVFPVWLITHRELHTSRRIRLVYDTLVEFLSDKKAN